MYAAYYPLCTTSIPLCFIRVEGIRPIGTASLVQKNASIPCPTDTIPALLILVPK